MRIFHFLDWIFLICLMVFSSFRILRIFSCRMFFLLIETYYLVLWLIYFDVSYYLWECSSMKVFISSSSWSFLVLIFLSIIFRCSVLRVLYSLISPLWLVSCFYCYSFLLFRWSWDLLLFVMYLWLVFRMTLSRYWKSYFHVFLRRLVSPFRCDILDFL